MKIINLVFKSVSLPIFIYATVGSFLFSCAPSTQITGTWKSPEATATRFNKVIVAALSDNPTVRQTVEDDLAAQLQKRGLAVAKSIDIMPPTMMRSDGSDPGKLLDRIKTDRHDAILTVAVVDRETESRYIPGTTAYAPMTRFGYYGNFRGYYTAFYPTMMSPGYYTEDKIYYLETNLYDAASEKLLWSAQSQTYNPSSLDRSSEKFAALTVSRLQQENLIP